MCWVVGFVWKDKPQIIDRLCVPLKVFTAMHVSSHSIVITTSRSFITCMYLSLKTHLLSLAGYMNPSVQGFEMQAGVGGSTEMDPGSMGQMDSDTPQMYRDSDSYGQTGFEDEPPLLQELGIDFEVIKQKVCPSHVLVAVGVNLLRHFLVLVAS